MLTRIREYAARLPQHIAAGEGLLLTGTTGTGKDHLLGALGREAICRYEIEVRFTSGAELFRAARDAMDRGCEGEVLRPLRQAAVLILSDPLPPLGSLSTWQAQVLHDLLDARWSGVRPTWCSLNVASMSEAAERMGAALVGRLQDRAIVLRCTWPSWRNPKEVR